MKNKKGFTLIELLAVIVILALIALIATPIILNMINESRKSSARTGTLSFVDAIEYYAGFSEINNTGIAMDKYPERLPKVTKTTGEEPETTTTKLNVVCEFTGSAWLTKYEDSDKTIKTFDPEDESVKLDNEEQDCAKFFGISTGSGVIARSRGKLPSKAKIIIDYKGKVQNGSTFEFNKYTCTYENLNAENCVKS